MDLKQGEALAVVEFAVKIDGFDIELSVVEETRELCKWRSRARDRLEQRSLRSSGLAKDE